VSLRLLHTSCLAQIPSAPIRLDPGIIIPNPSIPGSILTIILVGGEQLRAATLNSTQILKQDQELAVINQGKFYLRSHDLSRSMLPYGTTMLQKLTNKAKRLIPRQFNRWIKTLEMPVPLTMKDEREGVSLAADSICGHGGVRDRGVGASRE
jgi:hypothetical protein